MLFDLAQSTRRPLSMLVSERPQRDNRLHTEPTRCSPRSLAVIDRCLRFIEETLEFGLDLCGTDSKP